MSGIHLRFSPSPDRRPKHHLLLLFDKLLPHIRGVLRGCWAHSKEGSLPHERQSSCRDWTQRHAALQTNLKFQHEIITFFQKIPKYMQWLTTAL